MILTKLEREKQTSFGKTSSYNIISMIILNINYETVVYSFRLNIVADILSRVTPAGSSLGYEINRLFRFARGSILTCNKRVPHNNGVRSGIERTPTTGKSEDMYKNVY